jgi:branched-chain amino acid transport system substrate-binding protein
MLPLPHAVGRALVEYLRKGRPKTDDRHVFVNHRPSGRMPPHTSALRGDVRHAFARADTGVTAQALKLVAANPDAMLVVASGSGAAMPHMAIVERGFKGKIFQTHAAASRDLMRVGGKAVEGAYVVSGPAVIAEQLADSHPSKKVAIEFVQQYEKAYGVGSRNQFAGHGYDAVLVMEKIVPMALKKAKPGTKEFRAALRDAMETMGRTVVAHGVLNWTKDDHWGYTDETGVMLKVVNGDWKVE